MSCPECECLECFEAHPRSDDEIETEEMRFQTDRINGLYRSILNRDANPEELFDPAGLARVASFASVLIHTQYLGLMAVLHRVAELEADR
jgi:hypothetical protein